MNMFARQDGDIEKSLASGLVKISFPRREARRPTEAQVSVAFAGIKVRATYRISSNEKFSNGGWSGTSPHELYNGFHLETVGHAVYKSVSINSYWRTIGKMDFDVFERYFDEWAGFDVLTSSLASLLFYDLNSAANKLVALYFHDLNHPSRFNEGYCWRKTIKETEKLIEVWALTHPWELLTLQ